MSASLVISIIVIVLVFSLVFSAISYNRQLAIKRRQAQIRKHRQQAKENLALQQLLLKIDPEYPLINLLQRHIVHDLQAACNLSPNDASMTALLSKQKSLFSRYQNEERDNEAQSYVCTDAELSQAQRQLSQISKWIDILQNKGALPINTGRALADHIRRLKLNTDINTHLHQARQYGENNDVSMYQLHIKLARDVLRKSSLEIENKTERIKELTDILNEVKRTNKVVMEKSISGPDENQAAIN